MKKIDENEKKNQKMKIHSKKIEVQSVTNHFSCRRDEKAVLSQTTFLWQLAFFICIYI